MLMFAFWELRLLEPSFMIFMKEHNYLRKLTQNLRDIRLFAFCYG